MVHNQERLISFLLLNHLNKTGHLKKSNKKKKVPVLMEKRANLENSLEINQRI